MIKVIKIKRLWSGLASVRDYVVEDAIKKDITIRLELGSKSMTLTPENLKNDAFQAVGQGFQSKYSNLKYKLIDFPWKPDEK